MSNENADGFELFMQKLANRLRPYKGFIFIGCAVLFVWLLFSEVSTIPVLLVVGIVWVTIWASMKASRLHKEANDESSESSEGPKPMRARMGRFNSGSAGEKINPENIPVTFEDVAGCDNAILELREVVVDFLSRPEEYHAIGARMPRGILFHGPPGTGKTLLAKAAAKESNVPFFSTVGSAFGEMYVGVGTRRVKDLFSRARAAGRAIIFIDEIDAIGRKRGGEGDISNESSGESENTLNTLLAEMDGFASINSNVIVIGATNRIDKLDSALTRPGRFDRHISVDLPDIDGREAILRVHAKGKKISRKVDLRVIAQRTAGFSGADLENLLNEAAILAVRNKRKKVSPDDIENSYDRVIAGSERNASIISDEEKELIAWHELGHALVGEIHEHADSPNKVTIIPRGRSLGHTQATPERDKQLYTEEELLARIAVLQAGRAAEELAFDGVKTSGAQDDIKKATEIAYQMVQDLGMSSLGTISYPSNVSPMHRRYSEDIMNKIDSEASRIIDQGYDIARDIIESHSDLFERCAEELLEKETLTKSEIKELVREYVETSEELEPAHA